MEKPDFTDEQIDDYLMGLTDEKDRNLLEKALTDDQELNVRLKERKELVAGVEEYHAQALKNKLKKIHLNNFATPVATPTAKKRNIMPWLAAAASIALLVFALIWMNGSDLSTEELYAANFEPYKLNLSQRDSTDPQELEMEALYDKGQYAAAIPKFEALIAQGDQSVLLQLGVGIAKLENNQAQEALGHFATILAGGDLLYKDHAQWYSALAHLKLDDRVQAKSFLQPLANDETADHHKKAVELLKQMK